MIIAVTYQDGQVFQHFGHSEAFKLYQVEAGEIRSAQVGRSEDESIVGVLRRDGALIFHEKAGGYKLKKGDRILCARLV